MKVTAGAAAAVIAEPQSPPVPVEEESGPAEFPEVTEAAGVANEVEENAGASTLDAQQEPMPGEPLPGGSAGELFAPGACTEAADAADKLGASAPLPDAQPVPKEPSAREVAASDQMNEAAEKHGVMWARVKGFPHWPAQVMKGKPAEIRMDGVHRPSLTSLPVMFFGTLEIAWISPTETSKWQDGIKAKFHTKPKGRKTFDNALQQAVDFAVLRKWPQNWWSRRPPQPKAPGDPAIEADRKRDADEAASPDGAKRPAKAAKKEEAAGSGELRELIGAEDIASAPKRKGAAGRRAEPEPKPPPYQQLRQNMWVCKLRPKRMPKDEIPVCNCRLEVPRSPLQPRPSSAGPPLSPTKRQSVLALAAADLACNRLLRPDSAPAALLTALPLPQIASCEASLAAVAGLVPQPDVAMDLATSAPSAAPEAAPGADAAQLLAIEQLPADEQLPDQQPGPAELSSPGRTSAALPEAPPSPVQNGGFTAAPAAPDPEAALPVVAAPPISLQSSAAALRTGCGENCLNRLSYIHCDPRLCPCGLKCGNRPFNMLQLPKMDLFLTGNRGWGVKAAAHIPRGAFIVEYAGEVVDAAESKRRMAEAKATGDHNFYMMEMGPGLIIDARTKGTLARFINSSCAPNCEAQKWHDAATGEIRVGIFAAQDIDPGVELTYDYMFQHAGTAALAGAYRCMCGAPNCRGTMDTQPERFKDFGKRLDVFWDGDSVFYRGTVTAYSTTTRKHTILYDDNDVERVNLETVRYRWLDESAPMKLSPLREALEAGKTLLGEEMPSLDLEASLQPELPAIIPPPPDAAEAAAGDDAALPEQESAPDQDTAMPDVQLEQAAAVTEESTQPTRDNVMTVTVLQEAAPDLAVTPAVVAEVPSPRVAIEAASAGIEVPVLASNPLRQGSARGRKRVRGRGAKGRSAGKGRKRKAETDLEADFAQAPDALKAETPVPLEDEQEVQMPKHKMWLKRCQRESQEQDSPSCPDQLPTAHTDTPADLAHSGSQPSAELPAAGLEPSADPAPFTHVSARASAEPRAPDMEAAVEPAQFTHVSPQRPAQLPAPKASLLPGPAHFTQISPRRAMRPVIDSVEALAPAAQFTHMSAQRPADGLAPQEHPARSTQVFRQHPAQRTDPAGISAPAHPPQFTHLSALPRPMQDDMQQPAWLAPELRAGSALPATQPGAWERAAQPAVQPKQPFGMMDRPTQRMQMYLNEQSLGSFHGGMPARHAAAEVSGASSAGELDRAAPFEQQLQATRKHVQGTEQQLHAVLGPLGTRAPEQPRVIWPEPDQAVPPAGPPPVHPADRELTPDRMLQPWQSLSAKPAVEQARPRRSSLGRGRKGMLDGGLQAFHQLHREPPPHQGAPGLGSLQSGLGSAVLPGGLQLPQAAPLLSQNFLQSPVGMHMAMYNMLLLQNPQLRAQLPALASPLGGLASLPRPGGHWTLPQAPPALPFAPPLQGTPLPVLPQWPKLDINLASGLQPPAPSQQPVNFPQGMQAPFMSNLPAPGSPPALATLEAALAAEGAAAARLASQSLPGSTQPMPRGAALQQAEHTHHEAAGKEQRSSAALADLPEPAEAPESLPTGMETGAADMQTSCEVAAGLPPVSAPQQFLTAQETGERRSAGQPMQHGKADEPPTVAAQTEEAGGPAQPLRETGLQSDLAASVSANILASTAPPLITEAAALTPHASDSTHQDTAKASARAPVGPVGSHDSSALGMTPAQDDLSRPLGQVEASRLIGIRDDLDQLGAAQPDVPCRGHKGSHAEAPAETHIEQACIEGGTDIGVPQQEPPTAAELPGSSSAERQQSLQHVAPTDTQHETRLAAADGIADTPELQLSQKNNLPTGSGPHTAASAGQQAAPAAEVSMQAVDRKRLSEESPAGRSAAASGSVVGQSIAGTSQGNPAANCLTEMRPLPVSLNGGLDNGHMQQPGTPRLFDPTALLAKAQSPALNGLSEHSSSPRSIDIPAEPSMAISPGPPGADAELWSFLVDSPSPAPKAKHMAWAAQQTSPCFWKQNGTSHAPGE